MWTPESPRGSDLRFQIEQLLNVGRFSKRPIESCSCTRHVSLAGLARLARMNDRLGAIRGVRQQAWENHARGARGEPVPRRRPLGAAPAGLAIASRKRAARAGAIRWFDQAVEASQQPPRRQRPCRCCGDLDAGWPWWRRAWPNARAGRPFHGKRSRSLLPEQGDDTGGGPNARDRAKKAEKEERLRVLER